MTERLLKLLLIDADPVFRLGLRLCLEQIPGLQVVEAVETEAAALQWLADSEISTRPDLVILDPNIKQADHSPATEPILLGLQLCQMLKAQYPQLPILLLSQALDSVTLQTAQQIGVGGYCLKGTSIPELVNAIQQVADGQDYWPAIARSPHPATVDISSSPPERDTPVSLGAFARLRHNLRMSGLEQIDAALAEVTAQLQIPGLPVLDRAVLAGRWRELKASRWLVNHLLAPSVRRSRATSNRSSAARDRRRLSPPTTADSAPLQNLPELASSLTIAQATPAMATRSNVSNLPTKLLQSTLFDHTVHKLQSLLQNLTHAPLEIDILREEKKRELLYIILRQLEVTLDELRFSQVQLSQLPEKRLIILQDLWQAATTEFFGKYYTLRINGLNYEIVGVLLQDARLIQTNLLDRIPLVTELLAYLLFQTPLIIDNATYPATSSEAIERAESLLQNLLVQVANAVIQPLLNRFADVEVIKQNFYDRRLISTREIERFRNSLSWKYRLEKYVGEPQAIFESQHSLFILDSRGIAKISVYAPRTQELRELSGIQLAVTLVLETRDAIAPRVRAAIAFLGSGLVYVLTEVVGRGIGLVGRGILQGIGSAWQDNKVSRDNDRKLG